MNLKFLKLLIFSLVLHSCSNSNPGDINVGIQPMGNIPSDIIDSVSNTLKSVYGFNVTILQRADIPAETYTSVKTPRYRADLIIAHLKHTQPSGIDYTIGLMNKDISTTKKDKNGNIKSPSSKYSDWGIFGLGYRPGPSSVVSTFRLQTKDQEQFYQRLRKVCMHEIGHNLGLKHCTSSQSCVMRDAAETIKTIDQVDLILCQNCKSMIN